MRRRNWGDIRLISGANRARVVFLIIVLGVCNLFVARAPGVGVSAFTVDALSSSSSSGPSALVDAPQTGFSMKRDGGRTDPGEQEAVYEIMKATGNEWATSIGDVCKERWHGIECMPDAKEEEEEGQQQQTTYHVVSLSFGALSDDTAFPTCDPHRSFLSPSLARLPHIRSLFFYRCFSGNPQPVPAFLGRLAPSLHSLVLRDNAHVGPIPPELGNLTRLRVLDLHANRLSGPIPASLAALAALRSLDLSANRLSGPIPHRLLPACSPLNLLDLSDNLLDGPLPATLAGAASPPSRALIKMDLSRNRLSGPIPDTLLSGMDSLLLLDLSYNRLTGPLPATLTTGLVSLRTLILKSNPMMAGIRIPPDGFSRLGNLTVLVLSRAGLTGPIPESLGRVPALRVLHLDQNRLNGTIPGSLRQLKDLKELRLNDNLLAGPIPFDRETVWRMGRKLRLANNSGLCCRPGDGTGRDNSAAETASFLLGIGYCDDLHREEDGGPNNNAAAGTATTRHLISVPQQHSSPSSTQLIPVSSANYSRRSRTTFPIPALLLLVALGLVRLF